MKSLVILGHHDLNSFNHSIGNTVVKTLQRNSHGEMLHDLYSEGFDPLLTAEELHEYVVPPTVISEYCKETASAEGIVIIHPNWWEQSPAMVKGWIDRVLHAGTAYQFLQCDNEEGVSVGLLNAKCGVAFNTSNRHNKRELEIFGDPLEHFGKSAFSTCAE
jgi:NAD(P)H dehydrogenase (quinone)